MISEVIFFILCSLLPNALRPRVPALKLAVLGATGLLGYLLMPSSFYSMMGLARHHSERDMRAALSEITRAYHPDKGGDSDVFVRLVNLREVLKEDERAYDLFEITSLNARIGDTKGNLTSMMKFEEHRVDSARTYFYLFACLTSTMTNEFPFKSKLVFVGLTFLFNFWEQQEYNRGMASLSTPLDGLLPTTSIFQRAFLLRVFLALMLLVHRTYGKTLQQTKVWDLSPQLDDCEAGRFQSFDGLLAKVKAKLEETKAEESRWISKAKRWGKTALFLLILLMTLLSFVTKVEIKH